MSEGKKLLVVAEELNEMVASYIQTLDNKINKGILLGQSLNGIQVSMVNVLAQINLTMKIENGNS